MTAEVQPTPYDTLPNFVMRGLLVIPEMDEFRIRWSSEADLRDGLATFMWFAGVETVKTELQVPNCGRIDIWAMDGNLASVIEIKRSMTTVSACRKAYQQADMYRLYMQSKLMAEEPTPYVRASVFAAQWDRVAAAPAADVYNDVEGESIGYALSLLNSFGFPDVFDGYKNRPDRRQRIARRRESIARVVAGLDHADRAWVSAYEQDSVRDLTFVGDAA